jgi:hypothetical protein
MTAASKDVSWADYLDAM